MHLLSFHRSPVQLVARPHWEGCVVLRTEISVVVSRCDGFVAVELCLFLYTVSSWNSGPLCTKKHL